MKILVLTPWVPYPVTGACQQDRFYGYKQMQALGHEVHVISKIRDFQPREEIERVFKEEGIHLAFVPFVKNIGALLMQRVHRVLWSPSLIDGAALEYTDPVFERLVVDEVKRVEPDVIWLEYTHLWPLLRVLKRYRIPMIMKSSLNEPRNCRDENGWSLMSIIKSFPKYGGETIAAEESNFIFGITPVEEEWYRSRGAKHTGTLPLRGLSRCLTRKTHTDKQVLDVVFLSSSYNMGHNRDAFLYLVQNILPRVRQRAPGVFKFHLTGGKFPESFQKYLADDVIYEGFVPDIGAFIATMDIALCPWISGQGMQQKVFEPLCRSIPLITTQTAGYPFEPGKEVLLADHADEYVDHLVHLRPTNRRQIQADAAYAKAEQLFSEEALQRIVQTVLQEIVVSR